MSDGPTIHKITKQTGVAGQIQYTALVEYPGEDKTAVSFVGSTYGGPVVMVDGSFQTFVTNPERFGEFGKQWVRKFFA